MTSPKATVPWTTAAASARRKALPHFELQQISPHGAVFRSSRACEPGTSFAFGIHLPSARRHRLLTDLEAIVVDCRAVGAGASLAWEVTLVFDSVTPAQVSALRAASRIHLHLHHEPFTESGSFFGSGGFCELGLN